MKKIILVGGGGHCMSCIDVIEASGAFEIIGFVDNASSSQLGQEISFLGSDKDLPDLYKDEHCAFVTVGQIKTSETRKKIFNLLQSLNFTIPTITSPNSVIAKNSIIKEKIKKIEILKFKKKIEIEDLYLSKLVRESYIKINLKFRG